MKSLAVAGCWRAHISERRSAAASGDEAPEFLENLSALFLYWQMCSIILAGAFLPYTVFFWTYVISFGDQRYLPHAVIMHGLWGVSWLLISLPLGWTWYQWKVRYRLRAQARKGEMMAPPIHSLNVVGSLIGALLAFGLPFLQLVAHP
jgi:hypothetical protein